MVDRRGIRDVLLVAAADPDVIVRVAAVRGLGRIGPTLADDPPLALLAALEDDAEGVRTAEAQSLTAFRIGRSRSLPALIRSFEKARPDARPAHALVVERMQPKAFGADAVQAPGSALSSPDEEVRCLSASALVAFREEASPAIPALATSIGRPGRKREPAATPAGASDPMFVPDERAWWLSGPGSANRKEPALTVALTPGNETVPYVSRYLGETQIADGHGNVLARLAYEDGEGVVVADIVLGRVEGDLAPIPESFWTAELPPNTLKTWDDRNRFGQDDYATTFRPLLNR